MIVVIIAGGSGTRLWPLSMPNYPKHLLSVDGSGISLLQATYKRAKELTKSIYVITDKSHVEHVKKQLPDLSERNFIVEPARRGTASCVLAALARIGKRDVTDEPIAFMPADHYIRDTQGFIYSFKLAEETSKKYQRLVLIGIEPDYPSTGFGYIEKDGLFDEKRFIFNVDSFKEKPDHSTALSYLNSGKYLWNGGYFVGSIKTFLHAMKAVAPNMFDDYEKLSKCEGEEYIDTYLSLENISIDYALIEKVKDLLVLQASFDWMDLGSFADLHKAVDSDLNGNHIKGQVITEEVQNSFVQNYEDKPIALIGVDNLVVVNTSEGLLISRKNASQKVGDISKRINGQEK